MNNFIKYPSIMGGGDDIDVTPLVNKDNLVSITGYIKNTDSDDYNKLSELNSSNNFDNTGETLKDNPSLLEIKFKNISFVIRTEPISYSPFDVGIGFDKSLRVSWMIENNIASYRVYEDNLNTDETETLGIYCHEQ